MLRNLLNGFHIAFKQSSIARFSTVKTVKLTYIVQGTNIKKTVNATIDKNLWEVAYESEIPLEGACEGSGVCGTCHVILKDVGKIPPEDDDEKNLLEITGNKTEGSRLACKVKITEALDGATITIPSHKLP